MKTLIRAFQVLLPVAVFLLGSNAMAQGDIDLENEESRVAYAIGANIGENLAAQQILDGIDLNMFVAGMLDAVSGELKMQPNEIMEAIQTYMQGQADAQQAAVAGNLTASEEYLESNSQNDGVVTLESGLQYQIMESGPSSGPSPTTSDSVLAHYHGTLTDGTVFDSSVDRGEPATFGVSQVIAGWTEALQLMKVGDKWRLFIPPGMAYGEASPTPAIPPNSALIFEVELLEVR